MLAQTAVLVSVFMTGTMPSILQILFTAFLNNSMSWVELLAVVCE
jgi:hypothetical protein